MIWKCRKISSFFLCLCATAMFVAAFSSAHAQDGTDTSETDAAAVDALELYVMPRSGPFRPDQISIPQQDMISAWARSAHADASAEAFRHWDGDGEIPTACATCHSGAGFRAHLGLDGSEPGVQNPVPVGGVVDCDTCHNPGLGEITAVMLPSGIEHPVTPGAEAACMTCHVGREAGASVVAAVGNKADDTPDPELGFVNPHYALAGATRLGSVGGGGYQYPGKSYSGRFFHARPLDSCASCHNPHSLEVAETTCLTCHETGNPDNIRISRISFDGSGNVTKGIHADVSANADLLMKMIVDYSAKVAGTQIIFEPHYPYFFADADGDGRADTVDGRSQKYAAWTPRLLKAAYNWKFVNADPGAFAHNPPYTLELLYDSIEDLAGPLNVDMASLGISR